jgi:hypothetical protein
VHPKAAFYRSAQLLATGCLSNLGFQSRAIALERAPLRVELRKARRLIDSDRPAPYDRERNDYENCEDESHEGPSAQCYAAFRHARSLALRERGLLVRSSSLATVARFVISSPSACPRHVH